ncbi:MAG: ComEC/Rec2 family competence protein [Saprospirales bacterium]|nr:ComEC/Rec2 family competence protein [Saprospirales bacterium]
MSGLKQTHWPRQLSWKEMPMLRLLLPFLFGITLGISISGLPSLFPLIGISMGALGCLLLTRRKIPYRLRHGYVLFCLLFWVGAGSWLSRQHLALNWPDYFQHLQPPEAVWFGNVRDASSSSFPRAVINIQGYWDATGVAHPAKGKLLVYPETPLECGQVVAFQAEFQPIPVKKNPMDFDHRRFRFFQNIHHQAYLKSAQYKVLKKEPPHWMEAWRNKQIADWKALLKDPAVYSVATAMVLGYKEELPEEVRTTYAQTGASHVLAVSGLHVGLIYLLLTGLLRKGNTRKVIRIFNTLLCRAGIWGFALLTGATPSVVRASTMFSFILVGKQLGRGISIFNSIAASAFLLLLINPFWLFNIGFQLSYLAVLGIVVFQPRWYQLWIPQSLDR